ncbi:MAG: CDGSH iron-sulfur domain-containing protein [candidate division Zixibacteria bacterium]|nr:CDGSH iron-sulfur domain-containing protein [candidate division Zixibacteria bacterium]
MAAKTLKIKLIPNGPALVESGSFEIMLTDGTIKKKDGPFSLCRCGQSQKKPFCDGTHNNTGFIG